VLERHPEFRSPYAVVLDQLSRDMPEDAVVQSALGRKLLYENADETATRKALEHLEKAVRLGARTAEVERDIAEALARLQHLDQSVQHLRNALEIEPYDPLLHKTLALRLIALKNYPQALEAMRRYVELFPEDDFMRDLLKKASVAR
jgi:tetratricopeptide (TPR) repeat protein